MTHVIAVLENALETARNNAPIHAAEGNHDQAMLASATIVEISYALNILRAVIAPVAKE
jgi:hypothetical protein